MALGRVDPEDAHEPFCMTVLALKLSRAANGVSELHGEVSRQMWQSLYPNMPVDKVPIGHITNGIHLLGWMKGTVRQFWRKKLTDGDDGTAMICREKFGADWAAAVNHAEFWEKMTDPDFVSDEELWALRYKLRRELIEFARRRLLLQNQRVTQGDFIRFDHLLNPDALTIGFARRFATYKRAPLIFQQFENIVKLAHDKQRPVQFIFAGKAHPRDDEGKRFIQQIIHLSKHSELAGNLVFIENYDIHVARQMVSGCDIWLNNPRRPLEASGTSGMKAGCHGCMNLSILDGWWREGYDGTNGFAIGEDSHPDNIEEQDRAGQREPLPDPHRAGRAAVLQPRRARHPAQMDPAHPPADGHARAAIHHRPHGQGIHPEILPAEIAGRSRDSNKNGAEEILRAVCFL